MGVTRTPGELTGRRDADAVLRNMRYLGAHTIVGVVAGVLWACVCLAWRGITHTDPFNAGWAWFAPGIPVLVAIIVLAKRHHDVVIAVVGAALAAVGLVGTLVVAVRVSGGPIEEIGLGGAFILGLLFVGTPVGLTCAVAGGATARLAGLAHRRRMAGCCVACGYSLAGLGSGVCPECGRAV